MRNKLKILGIILIIIATFVTTVIGNKINNNLNSLSDKIANHQNAMIGSLLIMNSINDQFTQRRIDLFERNNLILKQSQNIPVFTELEERILETTERIIKRWHGSFRYTHEVAPKINPFPKEIINESSLSFDSKLKQLESIRKVSSKEAKKRLSAFQKKREEYRRLEKDKQNDQIFWNNIFLLFQIIGLIILSISEIWDNKKKT